MSPQETWNEVTPGSPDWSEGTSDEEPWIDIQSGITIWDNGLTQWDLDPFGIPTTLWDQQLDIWTEQS